MSRLQERVKGLMPAVNGVQPIIFQVQPTDDGGWCVKPVPGQIVADAPSEKVAYIIADCLNEALCGSSYREVLKAIRDAARRELRVAGDPLRAIEQTASNALDGVHDNPRDWITGTFVSVWDGGNVRTKARLNPKTGEVDVALEDVVDVDQGFPLDEYFEAIDGQEFPVCMNCHEYITKNVMAPDNVGNGLHKECQCMGHCEEER